MGPRRTLVNTVMNLPVKKNIGKFLSTLATGSFSGMVELHGVRYSSHEWVSKILTSKDHHHHHHHHHWYDSSL
jgi:hypothetical protein